MRIILFIKDLYARIFGYPRNIISSDNMATYDHYWDEKNKSGTTDLNRMQKKRADLILKNLKSDNKGGNISVADVGCGNGLILNYLNKNFGLHKMIGLDVAKDALKVAEKFGIEARESSITPDNIPEANYILFLEVLEHMTDPEALLQSAIKKSTNGVFFSVPNSGFIAHRLRFLFGKFPLQWRVYPGEHIRFWTLGDMKWWLSALELKKYTIYPYHGVPFLQVLAPALFAEGILVYIKK